jgi:hypothetical protein
MPSETEIKAMAEKAVAYLKTPEGRAELIARQKACHEVCEALRRAAKPDWKTLHEPFDI